MLDKEKKESTTFSSQEQKTNESDPVALSPEEMEVEKKISKQKQLKETALQEMKNNPFSMDLKHIITERDSDPVALPPSERTKALEAFKAQDRTSNYQNKVKDILKLYDVNKVHSPNVPNKAIKPSQERNGQ
ncbi:MAG: hypothetical protein WBJ81_04275 [Rickettsiales bacterium]